MDVNGARFQLLLGRDDWSRCRTSDGLPALDDRQREISWSPARHEITLWRREFRFPTSSADRRVSADDRRGAARDAFDNWYWIAPDRQSVLVHSSGSGRTSAFWPPEPPAASAPRDDAAFRACAPAPAAPVPLQGLAITDDHYLVVGTTAPAGLLVFDLYSGGAPRQLTWDVPFEPFDIAPRERGGVWVLDRAHRLVWMLDRRFEVVLDEAAPAGEPEPTFTSADGTPAAAPVRRVPLALDQAWPVPARDPIAVAAFPAGGVLVLDADAGGGFASIHWLDGGAPRSAPAPTALLEPRMEIRAGDAPFTLVAQDFTFVPGAGDSPGAAGRVFIVGAEGNQAHAFDVAIAGGSLTLDPAEEYFPMRLYGGRAIVTAGAAAYYDSGTSWLPLLKQHKPRYADRGEVRTPALDSGEPGCVWHRVMLDACIPPGTRVEVHTRAADDQDDLDDDLVAWDREPDPYPRGDGPELPYLPRESGDGRATWELLCQRARGRYLQVRLGLRGDGRTTPRIRALRAWHPRFSYRDRYLPAVYRDDPQSASFVERFLANVEGTLTAIEDRIAAAQRLFDVDAAPADALAWLATWFGVALDPAWDHERRRLFLRHAMTFFAARGTLRGLELALRLTLDDCVDDRLFAPPTRIGRGARPVRIIERFRARRTPPALLGDVGTTVPGPAYDDPSLRWQPSAGGAALHARYREAFDSADAREFPLAAADGPPGWEQFAARTLGFVPAAGAADRRRWQQFLQQRYGSLAAINDAHDTTWASVERVRLPIDRPTGRAGDDWGEFVGATPAADRARWQDFLARRYRAVTALNDAWRTNWTAFARVALADRLPPDGAALADWYQFEGTVLAMHRTAHRFTVMLPVPRHLRTDTPAQRRRLALAKLVLDLEKPAHTTYDVRFYWAMFRLGEARLGDDTLIDLGSRAPELMAPMVLGDGYLAEAFLAARPGRDAPRRTAIGRDRLGRSTRLGGP